MMVGDVTSGGAGMPLSAHAEPAAAGFADILGQALPLAGADVGLATWDGSGGRSATGSVAPVAVATVLPPDLTPVVTSGAAHGYAADGPVNDRAGQLPSAVSSLAEVVIAMPASDAETSPREAAVAGNSESPEIASPEAEDTESVETILPPPPPGLVSWILAGMPPVRAPDDPAMPGPPQLSRLDDPARPAALPVSNAGARSDAAGPVPPGFPSAAMTAAVAGGSKAENSAPIDGAAPPQTFPPAPAAQVAPLAAITAAAVPPGSVAEPAGETGRDTGPRGDKDNSPGSGPRSPQRVHEAIGAAATPASQTSALGDMIAPAGGEAVPPPTASDTGPMQPRPTAEPTRSGDTRPSPMAAAPAPAAELRAESARLGDVGIALEGGTRDLRVQLSIGGAAGGGATVLAEAPRLAAELATQGVRLQGLSVADGTGAGQWQPPSPGGGESNRQRPSPDAAAAPGPAAAPAASPARRWGKGDRYA